MESTSCEDQGQLGTPPVFECLLLFSCLCCSFMFLASLTYSVTFWKVSLLPLICEATVCSGLAYLSLKIGNKGKEVAYDLFLA